jgi:hypothetical protein
MAWQYGSMTVIDNMNMTVWHVEGQHWRRNDQALRLKAYSMAGMAVHDWLR